MTKLQKWRLSRGFTPQDIADRLGVTLREYRSLEADQRAARESAPEAAIRRFGVKIETI